MERLELHIDGMSCDHCVRAVRNALQQVNGVTVEQVKVGSATVTYDPARATRQEIVEAVNDEGYDAHTASVA
ncbi:MAG TPA: heavy-metal-associated domain-containing protein [Gemmatimonadaceae bacterium]|nr:heavy-metal-associated domain-containing protein [Gemmatimonadaceae bacterium]